MQTDVSWLSTEIYFHFLLIFRKYFLHVCTRSKWIFTIQLVFIIKYEQCLMHAHHVKWLTNVKWEYPNLNWKSNRGLSHTSLYDSCTQRTCEILEHINFLYWPKLLLKMLFVSVYYDLWSKVLYCSVVMLPGKMSQKFLWNVPILTWRIMACLNWTTS